MFPDANGVPDPATRQPFINDASGPVDIQVGPGGDLFYVDLNGGTVRRVHALASNHAPVAHASGSPSSGPLPLQVSFNGTTSTDPDGDALTYAWDLDGDGAFDDSTASQPSFTYTTGGVYTVRLRVTDPGGLNSTDTVTITAGTPPTATITTPTAGTTWKVGDVISFSGSATDGQGNPVPPSGLSWKLVMQHCSALVPTSCHAHNVQSFPPGDSFTAPDHEYPAYLELQLTATSGGLSSTVTRRLDPKTVDLTFETQPAGLNLSVGSEEQAAPFTRTAIQGSTVSLIAPPSQPFGGKTYEFASWSDGGAAAHTVTAGTTPATYRANYTEAVCQPVAGLVGGWGFDEPTGTVGERRLGSWQHRNDFGRHTHDGREDRFGADLRRRERLGDGRRTARRSTSPRARRLRRGSSRLRSAERGAPRVLKEQAGQLVYALYANNDLGRPSGHLFTTGDLFSNGTAAAAAERLVASGDDLGRHDAAPVRERRARWRHVPSAARFRTAPAPLRFGGNGVWSEWFRGGSTRSASTTARSPRPSFSQT